MMTLLFYTLPSLLFIVAIYLWYTKHELQQLLNLNTTKGIIALSCMYFSLAILGFILLLLAATLYFYLWLVVVALSSLITTALIYQVFK